MRLSRLVSIALAGAWLTSQPASADDCRQRPVGAYDPATFVGAESCAACHPRHYDEWQGSAHAYAVVDPVFWGGNEASYEVNEIENFCLTCHSPIADVINPEPDPAEHAGAAEDLLVTAQAGVTCETCHRIYDVTGGIKQLTGCQDHYFGPIADSQDSPHGVEYEPSFDRAGFCKPCHDVNMSPADHNGLIGIEFTNTEWEAANAAAGGTAEAPAIATCQDCHMPTYTGQAAVDGPERTVHSHFFAGPDAAIVPFADSHRQYRASQALVRTAGDVTVEQDGPALRVDVTNNIIGHDLPSGSAHARAVWVHVRVVGADGEVYLESGDVDENGDLRDANSEIDPYGDEWIASGESVFRQYMYDAAGEEVVAAYGEVVRVDKQMLSSGETRSIWYDLSENIPTDAAYPLDVEVELLFRPASNFILRALGLPDEQIARVPTYTIASTSTIVTEAR